MASPIAFPRSATGVLPMASIIEFTALDPALIALRAVLSTDRFAVSIGLCVLFEPPVLRDEA